MAHTSEIATLRSRQPVRLIKDATKWALRRCGYRLTPYTGPVPADFADHQVALWELVAPYTMTTPDSVAVLADAIRYVLREDIPGAVVECGVWRGGSMMAAAKTLLDAGKDDIDIYLYDTFEGMTDPTEQDVHWSGRAAREILTADTDRETSTVWARAALGDVQRAMGLVPYPEHRLHFVRGPVEDTLPVWAPAQISLLRLDTDWYESTRHELIHLYPRLSAGGVLIIDDYGWWRGARMAADEYFAENPPFPMLVRIDDGGARLAIKPPDQGDRG
jgi:O-methyltransferase